MSFNNFEPYWGDSEGVILFLFGGSLSGVFFNVYTSRQFGKEFLTNYKGLC